MNEAKPNFKRALIIALAMTVGLLLLTFADKWIWAHAKVRDPEALQKKDWYQFLRQLGSLYIWGAAALVMVAYETRTRWRGPRDPGGRPLWSLNGAMLIASAALGGAAAELVKVATHRYRPGESGDYLFSWAMDGDRGPGFGLASSHAGVAFGAAFMLARLFPGTGCVAIAFAVGCAVSRLLVGAHFATDVYVAACLSYGVAAGLWRLDRDLASRAGRIASGGMPDQAQPPSDFE
jgi:membrane-associated phospholipid phosphatase